MKKMTCREMGGSCDTVIEGDTPEEMVANGAKHLSEMSEKDEAHKKDKAMMDEAQKDPAHAQEWFEKFKVKFDALSEE
jgi:hypothetical protein